MALPALAKTWQFNVNQTITGASTTILGQNWVYALYLALTSFGSNPWTIRRSSDASSVADSDLWSGAGGVTFGANSSSARSWAIFKQSGIGANFELLWDCSMDGSGNPAYNMVYISWAGFTGGTTTARPTATDEVLLCSSGTSAQTIYGHAGSTATHRLHVMQSTDGECTRVVSASGGLIYGFHIYDKAQNAIAEFNTPAIVSIAYNTPSYSSWFNTADLQEPLQFIAGGIRSRASMTTECSTTGRLCDQITGFSTIANDLNGEWPMYRVGWACPPLERAGYKGKHGSFADLWVAASGTANGDGYPGDGTNQFAQFTCLVLPWPGGSTAISLT